MENLESLEKAINSELTTKILSSKIKHDQINICIEDNNLSEVMIFLFILTVGFIYEWKKGALDWE